MGIVGFINIITQLKKNIALFNCGLFVFIGRCGAKVTQNENRPPPKRRIQNQEERQTGRSGEGWKGD